MPPKTLILDVQAPIVVDPKQISLPSAEIPALQNDFMESLMDSMRVIGHCDPVHVVAGPDGRLTVIQGGGVARVVAAQVLNVPTMLAHLWEGDELRGRLIGIHKDVVRKHLTTLQLQELRAELVSLYKQLEILPPTGVYGTVIRQCGYKTFSEVATQVGCKSPRSLHYSIQIARDIHPDAKAEITARFPEVASNTNKLLAIARAAQPTLVQIEEAAAAGDQGHVEELKQEQKENQIALAQQLLHQPSPSRAPSRSSSGDGRSNGSSAGRLSVIPGGKQDASLTPSRTAKKKQVLRLKQGDWLLLNETHRVFIGSPDDDEFKSALPQHVDLAYVDPGFMEHLQATKTKWNLDWLVRAARAVVVALPVEDLFLFARTSRMPFDNTVRFDAKDGMVFGVNVFSNFVQPQMPGVCPVECYEEILTSVAAFFAPRMSGESVVLLPGFSPELLEAADRVGLTIWTAAPRDLADGMLDRCQTIGFSVETGVESEELYFSVSS